ncbi:hypothetical protein OJ996_19895 [Luteolibacter sp. GHJ8]|uniref:Ferritin-like metal-binding protein YciE n=1 Tax=Luteolibacter rhizosphaerae TaxID=2989719 RepID=A0ABT3G9I2_9BACT|nr:hypothetical protein [Luteolibacter rhizosphaerae]MCW1915860.1 hypothetical protein [Luteolibacter rhizosphaerae]
MDDKLSRYLNDHLAGSAGAVDLIEAIAKACEEDEDIGFYRELGRKVEQDRKVLHELILATGKKSSRVLETAGKITAKAGRLKLMWEGLEPGDLGLFEALEMLVLGIQGKRILWVVLRELQPWTPEWEDIDFAALEAEAIAQRDAVEERRVTAAMDALLSPERRAAKLPEMETQVLSSR